MIPQRKVLFHSCSGLARCQKAPNHKLHSTASLRQDTVDGSFDCMQGYVDVEAPQPRCLQGCHFATDPALFPCHAQGTQMHTHQRHKTTQSSTHQQAHVKEILHQRFITFAKTKRTQQNTRRAQAITTIVSPELSASSDPQIQRVRLECQRQEIVFLLGRF